MRNVTIIILFIIFIIGFFLTAAAQTYDPAVYEAQKALEELGYDPGLPDGIWGKKTTTAVKSFQSDNGLPVTGQLDARTKTMLNSKIPSFRLSLIEAVKENHLVTVKALLDAGADVNAQDKFGDSLLHLAAVRGLKEMSAMLIAGGADVAARDERGLTPLHAAAWGGHKEILVLLLNKNVDINVRSTDGLTPLHMAALSGHKETIEYLILKGADINARSADGMTPLHAAAFKGHKEAVELLVASGADVGAENADGVTPLQMAFQEGYPAVVKLLRKYGSQNKIVR
jgi:ankyrin repeat protein